MEFIENARLGLSPAQVERSRAAHGKNQFTKARGRGFWKTFFGNLGNPVIKVLLLALLLHVVLLFRNPDWLETSGIAASVLLATLISTLSEYSSERAFSRLFESCGAALCRVRRHTVQEIESDALVVGDVVLLGAGEKIPADGVLLCGNLSVDQSALTGESHEVEKRPDGAQEALTPASPGALFAGCSILSGEGEMRITRVGDATFLGGISGELQTQKRDSPLKRRLEVLAGQISRLGYAAALVCALAYLFNVLVLDSGFCGAEILHRLKDLPFLAQELLHALTLALTVVVVAVPEGLPMMIAVVLSANIRRMVRDSVLVRKPEGLEAAGSMNILFTDKTGTLTAGKLSICAILTPQKEYKSCKGLAANAPALYEALSLCAHAGSGAVRGVCNGQPAALGGNVTDRALLTAFLESPAPVFHPVQRLPFDSTRKYAATRLDSGDVWVTGAPERLLPHVRGSYLGKNAPHFKAVMAEKISTHAANGERVILLCHAERMPDEQGLPSLTLVAAVCFCDALRPEAGQAVRTLQQAGIQVVMVTGDSPETARALARACGILRGDGVALTGEELAHLSDEALTGLLPRLAVVARALPGDKSRLIRLSEAAGLVVGMTGDGINDAPALRHADVGFAMGSGTQVAREAGDIVILDDNLASVTRAVLYGRTIFKSIRKFITLQLVMNFCAVGISLIGPFIGIESPVTVVQMLWINLIMDTLGGLAFAGEAPLPFYMKEAPKRRDEPILNRALTARIAMLTLFTLGLFLFFLKSPWVRSFYRASEGDLCLLTAFFALFIFASVFNCFNARTDRVRMLVGLRRNPTFLLIMGAVAAVQVAFVYLGGTVLRTMPLTPRELLFTLLLSLSVLPLGFLHLFCRRLSNRRALY